MTIIHNFTPIIHNFTPIIHNFTPIIHFYNKGDREGRPYKDYETF